jgi:cytochrome c553
MRDLLMPTGIIIFLGAIISFAYEGLSIKGQPVINGCFGECYDQYVVVNGTPAEQELAKQAEAASQSPAVLGQKSYTAVCQACHGDKGQGLVGPALTALVKSEVIGILQQYKNNETRGEQSAVMWGQAAILSDSEMDNIASYIETL